MADYALPSPVLHVVYGAYGDAFLLEYQLGQVRKLMLLDGGPTSRGVTDHQWAPYSRNYVAVAKLLWKQFQHTRGQPVEATIKPNAIINSHPDHDHYEGLMYLLNRLWPVPPSGPGGVPPPIELDFTGPFLLPVPTNPNGTEFKKWEHSKKAIEGPLTKRQFKRTLLAGPLDDNSPLAGLHIFYPAATNTEGAFTHVSSWNRPAGSPLIAGGNNASTGSQPIEPEDGNEGGDDDDDGALVEEKEEDDDEIYSYTLGNALGHTRKLPKIRIKKPVNADIDQSKTNLSSILLCTVQDTGGQIMMTGDSVGWRVNGETFANVHGRPHVNIYKVQHHGSVKNNQLLDQEPSIGKEIAAEVALRELLELGIGATLDGLEADWKAETLLDYYSIALGSEMSELGVQSNCHLIAGALWNKWYDYEQARLAQAPPGTQAENLLEEDVVLMYLNYLRERHNLYLFAFKTAEIDGVRQLNFTRANILTTKIVQAAINGNQLHPLPWAPDPQQLFSELIEWRINIAESLVTLNQLADLETQRQARDQLALDYAREQLKRKRGEKKEAQELFDAQLKQMREDAKFVLDDFYEVFLEENVALSRKDTSAARKSRHKNDDPPPAIVKTKDHYPWKLRPRYWWGRWDGAEVAYKKDWLAFYNSLAAVPRVMDFYRTFTADAYVISANGTHGHPDTATILGIAYVAIEDEVLRQKTSPDGPPIRRSLYVTNGHALPLEPMAALARRFPEYPIDQVIGLQQGCFAIRYLAIGAFMSISGFDVPKDQEATYQREFTNSSSFWDLDTANDIEKAYADIEHDQPILPRDTQEKVHCVFGTHPEPSKNPNPTFYLANPPENPLTNVEPGADDKNVFKIFDVWQPIDDMRYLNMWTLDDALYWRVHYEIQKYGGYSLYFTLSGLDFGPRFTWYKDFRDSNNPTLTWLSMDEARELNKGTNWSIVQPVAFYVIRAKSHPMALMASQPMYQLTASPSYALAIPNQTTVSADVGDWAAAVEDDDTAIVEDEAGVVAFDLDATPTVITPDSSREAALSPTVTAMSQTGNGTLTPLKPVSVSRLVPDSAQDSKLAQGKPAGLDQFLKDSQVSTEPDGKPLTMGKVMETILGASNYSKLPTKRTLEKTILGYPVDVGASIVTYEKKAFNNIVTAASLRFAFEGRKLVIDGEPLSLSGGFLDIKWPAGEAIELEFRPLFDDKSVSLSVSRRLESANVIRATTLLQLLSHIFTEAGQELNFKSLALPRLLAYLTGRTRKATAAHLLNSVPALLIQAGMLSTPIDLENSTVIAHPGPASGLIVERADVTWQISKLLRQANEHVAGLDMQFGELKVVLENAGLPIETLTLVGSVTVASLILSFSVAMSNPGSPGTAVDSPAVLWTFQATSTTELSKLTALWPNDQAKLKPDQSIPFSKSPLSGLQHSGIGFVVSQPVAQIAKYELWSLFGATTFDDWKAFLPPDFLPTGVGGTGRLEIRNPLDKDRRTYGVAVDFHAPIQTAKEVVTLNASLTAEPLPGLAGYEYRVYVSGDGAGITLMELASAAGIGAQAKSLAADVPIVEDVLEKFRIQKLAVALERADNQSTVREFGLKVTVEKLTIGQSLSIDFAELDLDYSFGVWQGRAAGRLTVVKKALAAEIILPTAYSLGSIKVAAPDGLSISDLMEALGLPSLQDVPVIGDLLKVELVSMSLVLEKEGKKSKITGSRFQLHHSKITVGSIELVDIDAIIETDTVKKKGKDPATMITVSISAHVPSRSFAATLTYNSLTKRLSAAFQATRAIVIADAIAQLIGADEKNNVFDDLIGKLGVESAGVEFDVANNFRPSMVSIHLVNTATASMGSASLQSLRLDYIAGTPAVEGKPGRPSFFNLVGVVKGKDANARLRLTGAWGDPKVASVIELALEPESAQSLKLSGLMSLLLDGTQLAIKQPPGLEDPSFPDLIISEVSGSVAWVPSDDGKTKKAQLQTLDVVVESDKAWPKEGIRLEKFSVAVHFTHGSALTADVWAFLKVDDQILVAVRYYSENDQTVFRGTLGDIDTKNEKKTPDYRALADKYLGKNNYDIPKKTEVPERLPMAFLDVTYEPGKKFELRAKNDGLAWPIKGFGTLDIKVTGLGGRLTANLSEQKSYDAVLYGRLSFDAFTSATAVLQLAKGKKPVLTAMLQKQAGAVNEIRDLVGGLSGDADSWKNLQPAGTQAIVLAETAIALVLDFEASVFLLAGRVKDVGSALLLAKKTQDKYDYLIYLKLNNIAALWPDLQKAVGDWFTFEIITVQISTKERKISELQQDMAAYGKALTDGVNASKKEDPDKAQAADEAKSRAEDEEAKKTQTELSGALSLIPADQKIPKGACIHATIGLGPATVGGTTPPISGMLALSTEKESPQKPKIYLDAYIGEGRFLVAIVELPLFGGAMLVRRAAGEWDAGKKQLTMEASLELKIEGNAKEFAFHVSFNTSESSTSFKFVQGEPLAAPTGGENATPAPTSGDGAAPASDGSAVAPTQPAQPVVIRDAFGGLFDLSLAVSKFSGTITKPAKQGESSSPPAGKPSLEFELSGQVKIGSLTLDANIYFVNGVPKLVKISSATTLVLPIGSIFEDIINNGTTPDASWPADFGDLQLKAATIRYSKYDREYTAEDGTVFKPNLNISADIEIFGLALGVNVYLPPDRSGVRIDGTFPNAIDWGFLKFFESKAASTADTSTHQKGPVVSVYSQKSKESADKNVKTYQVSAGLTVLDKPSFKVDLSYSNKVFTGEATYDGTIDVFGAKITPKVTIKHANGKFSISAMDMSKTLDLDIEKAIKDASKIYKKECKDLLKIIFDQALKTECNWSVGLDGVDKTAVNVLIGGTFKVVLKIPIIDRKVKDMAKLTINFIAPIPFKDFSFEALVKLLGKAMQDNLSKIGQAIMENKEEAFTLIEWMSAKEWGADLIGALICRRMDPPNVWKRFWELTPKDPKDPDDKNHPGGFWKWLLGAAAAIFGVAVFGLGGMLAAFETLVGGAVAFARTAAEILRMLDKAIKALETNPEKGGSGGTLKDAKDFRGRMEKTLADAKAKLLEVRQGIRETLNLSKPPEATLTGKGSALRIDWSKAMPQKGGKPFSLSDVPAENFKWEIYVSGTNKSPSDDVASPETDVYETKGTSIQIHNAKIASFNQVYAWVRAKYTDAKHGSFASAKWASAAVLTNIPRLPQPSLQIALDSTCMNYGVTIAKAVPGSYVIALILVASGKAGSAESNQVALRVIDWQTNGQDLNVQIPLADLRWHRALANGVKRQLQLQARVHMKSSNASVNTDSSFTWSNLLPVLQAPSQLTASYATGQLNATWQEEEPAKGYEMVVKQAGKTLYSAPAPKPPVSIATKDLQLSGGRANVDVFVRIQPPPKGGVVTLFASDSVQVADLPVPTVTADSFFDVPTQTFYISMSLSASLATADLSSFLVYPISASPSDDEDMAGSSSPPIYIYDFYDTQDDNKDTVLLKLPKSAISSLPALPQSLQISAVDADERQGSPSAAWTLPTPLPDPSSVSAVAATAEFDKVNKTMLVSWKSIPAGVTRVAVVVTERDTDAQIRRDVVSPAMGITITAADFALATGQKLGVACTSWMGKMVRGGMARFPEIEVPSLEAE